MKSLVNAVIMTHNSHIDWVQEDVISSFPRWINWSFDSK